MTHHPLSPDLILEILKYVDYKTLMRCALVSKRFRALINASVILQYHKELYISGKQDIGLNDCNLSTSSRLACLRKHVDYWENIGTKPLSPKPWRHLRYFGERRPPIREGVYFGYCCEYRGSTASVEFTHLPTALTNLNEESPLTFKCDFDNEGHFGGDIVACDPSQDLLVTVSQSPMTTEIGFFTISTSNPHPDRPIPLEIPEDEDGFDGDCQEVVIQDDKTALLRGQILDMKINFRISVWNWKTGIPISHVEGKELSAVAFLTSETLLVTAASSNHESLPNCALLVWNFVHDDPGVKHWTSTRRSLILNYPPLKEPYEISEFLLYPTSFPSKDPLMTTTATIIDTKPVPLSDPRKNQFLTVTLNIAENRIDGRETVPWARQVVPLAFLDWLLRIENERAAQAGSQPQRRSCVLPWHFWGRHTRIIPHHFAVVAGSWLETMAGSRLIISHGAYSGRWEHLQSIDVLCTNKINEEVAESQDKTDTITASTSKETVETVGDFKIPVSELLSRGGGVSKLAIYDFNQTALRHSLQNGGILVDDPVMAMKLDRGQGEIGKTYCVRAPTTWFAEQFEQVPSPQYPHQPSALYSGLHYRLRFAEVEEIDLRDAGLICTMDYIIIPPVDDEDVGHILV